MNIRKFSYYFGQRGEEKTGRSLLKRRIREESVMRVRVGANGRVTRSLCCTRMCARETYIQNVSGGREKEGGKGGRDAKGRKARSDHAPCRWLGASGSFHGSRRGRRRSTGDADGGRQRERRLRAGTNEVRCALIALDRPYNYHRGAPSLLSLVSRAATSTASNDSDSGSENARSTGRTERHR